MPAKVVGESLDGITEHGAGHHGAPLVQEGAQPVGVALPRLAEQPSDGLLDQVVPMVKEDVGDGEGVVQLSMTDEGHGRDDADPLFPEGF